MLTAKKQGWLHRNLERNQLLIDLLVGTSSWLFWLTFLWFWVHAGNEGEQDNAEFLELCSLCLVANKHHLNVNWNISYWHMLHSCCIVLHCKAWKRYSFGAMVRLCLCKFFMISILTRFITVVIDSNYQGEISGCFTYTHLYFSLSLSIYMEIDFYSDNHSIFWRFQTLNFLRFFFLCLCSDMSFSCS